MRRYAFASCCRWRRSIRWCTRRCSHPPGPLSWPSSRPSACSRTRSARRRPRSACSRPGRGCSACRRPAGPHSEWPGTGWRWRRCSRWPCCPAGPLPGWASNGRCCPADRCSAGRGWARCWGCEFHTSAARSLRRWRQCGWPTRPPCRPGSGIAAAPSAGRRAYPACCWCRIAAHWRWARQNWSRPGCSVRSGWSSAALSSRRETATGARWTAHPPRRSIRPRRRAAGCRGSCPAAGYRPTNRRR